MCRFDQLVKRERGVALGEDLDLLRSAPEASRLCVFKEADTGYHGCLTPLHSQCAHLSGLRQQGVSPLGTMEPAASSLYE